MDSVSWGGDAERKPVYGKHFLSGTSSCVSLILTCMKEGMREMLTEVAEG